MVRKLSPHVKMPNPDETKQEDLRDKIVELEQKLAELEEKMTE